MRIILTFTLSPTEDYGGVWLVGHMNKQITNKNCYMVRVYSIFVKIEDCITNMSINFKELPWQFNGATWQLC